MSKPGANLNKLLAWFHSRSVKAALEVRQVEWGMLDQFSKAPLTQQQLKNFKLITISDIVGAVGNVKIDQFLSFFSKKRMFFSTLRVFKMLNGRQNLKKTHDS